MAGSDRSPRVLEPVPPAGCAVRRVRWRRGVRSRYNRRRHSACRHGARAGVWGVGRLHL